jgi:hypothetical protein
MPTTGLLSGAVPNTVGSPQSGGQGYQHPLASPLGQPVICSIALEKVVPVQKITFESFPSQEGIQENYTASYDQSKGLAPQPIAYYYTGGNWGPFTLSLDFKAGMVPVTSLDQALAEMYKKVRWCQALPFPRSDTKPPPGQTFTVVGGIPPYVLVTIGSFMTIRGLCTGVNITWLPPWDPRNGNPHTAKVDIIIQPHLKVYPDWYWITGDRGTKAYPKLTAMSRMNRAGAALNEAAASNQRFTPRAGGLGG